MASIYYERFDCDDQGWNRLVGAHVFHKPSYPPLRERGFFMCGISKAWGKVEIERIDAGFHVLLFCLEGQGELFEGDTVWPFRAGQMAFQPARGQRGYRRTGDAPLHLVWFLLHGHDARWTHLNTPHCHVHDNEAGWRVHDAVSLFQREAERWQRGQNEAMLRQSLDMVSRQLEAAVAMPPAQDGWPLLLQQLFSRVAEAPEQAWSNQRLADELNITPMHLHRLSLIHLGQPPGQQVQAIRMAKARQWLLAGKPVNEVALLVGYHELASFSRRFRLHFGVSPSAIGRQAPSGPHDF